ncbi:hypothetical protein M3223_04190 [Paenibacillus pasadenensis]|uniref:hypothetical protein n=1 Tax=Paenibacillus pasadenensis TaxID=217090 RepID=UPI00203E2C4F|nr:hypothetical protein [Paenibacillus pasadenensis]MCM3746549.1 hypothetical protein [Paenibacillus pasadenensis]
MKSKVNRAKTEFDHVMNYLLTESTKCNTHESLYALMATAAHTIGGMVCHFDADERSQILMHLTAAMGTGLQVTAKAMGEPSDIEIILGGRS